MFPEKKENYIGLYGSHYDLDNKRLISKQIFCWRTGSTLSELALVQKHHDIICQFPFFPLKAFKVQILVKLDVLLIPAV